MLEAFGQFGGNTVRWEEKFQRENVYVLSISRDEVTYIINTSIGSIKKMMTEEKRQGKEGYSGDDSGWVIIEKVSGDNSGWVHVKKSNSQP